MGHATGYADVDALLAELLAGVRGTLGPSLDEEVDRLIQHSAEVFGALAKSLRRQPPDSAVLGPNDRTAPIGIAFHDDGAPA